MSAVALQRPLFLHHLHLQSQLRQLAVHRSARWFFLAGGRGTSTGRVLKRSLICGSGRTEFPGGRWHRCESLVGVVGDVRLPWMCTCEVDYRKVARRCLKNLKNSRVVLEDDKATMEEKYTARKRPTLQPKQLNLRSPGVHGNTFISYVQILGTGMDTRDTAPSVLLFFDKRRIIFNAGEGLQRFCIEHKIKLSKACNLAQLFDGGWASFFCVFSMLISVLLAARCSGPMLERFSGIHCFPDGLCESVEPKNAICTKPALCVQLDHVFLTRVGSETASGLPGLLLTLSNTGETGMAVSAPKVHGVLLDFLLKEIASGVQALEYFVRKEMPGSGAAAGIMEFCDTGISVGPSQSDLLAKVNLWGPSDLKFLVDAMRTFIPSSSVVHTHSFGAEKQDSPTGSSSTGNFNPMLQLDTLLLLDDEVVEISAVLLQPPSAEKQVSPVFKTEESGSFKSNKFQGSIAPASIAQRDSASFTFAEPWELGFENEITSDLPGSQKRARVEPALVDEGFKLETRVVPVLSKGSSRAGAGTHGPLEVAVVYICELPRFIGKFDPEKAKALGLRPSSKYGQLQAGKSVLSDDGKNMVHPHDVMDPSSPGPICLVVDCPTISYVPSLITAPGIKKFFSKTLREAGQETVKKVTCIIHIGPAVVVNCSQYREWMGQFEDTQHIMAGHGMLRKVSPVLKSSARLMSRLNFICPQVFPVAGLQQVEDEMDICPDDPTGTALVTTAENLLKFRLRPISVTPFDRSLVPTPLDISAVQAELTAENPGLQDASKTIAKFWNVAPGGAIALAPDDAGPLNSSPRGLSSKAISSVVTDPMRLLDQRCLPPNFDDGLQEGLPDCLKGVGREEMEIVFLGTGSSQPSKYRNVSAIYIHLFRRGGVLLDCGEGTYAQLKRRYGNKAADEIVGGLKCVWISHIHADHHTGLARILSVRKKVLECQDKLEPILVVGPKQLKRYLDAYGRLEDLGMEFLDCSQTTLDAERAASLIAKDQGSAGGGMTKCSGRPGSIDTIVGMESVSNGVRASEGLVRLSSPEKLKNAHGKPVHSQLRNYWLQSGFNFQAGLDEQGREKLKLTLSELGLLQLISVPVVHCPHAFGVVLVARGKKLLQPGWQLVYSGDTRPCQALVEASEGATVLIHEATFDDAMPEEAIAKSHSLTREAIETGVSAGAYRTILTHFSQRYPKIPVFNESYNNRTCVAFDMMSVNLADLPFLPRLLPALKLLFKDDMMTVEEGGEDMVDRS